MTETSFSVLTESEKLWIVLSPSTASRAGTGSVLASVSGGESSIDLFWFFSSLQAFSLSFSIFGFELRGFPSGLVALGFELRGFPSGLAADDLLEGSLDCDLLTGFFESPVLLSWIPPFDLLGSGLECELLQDPPTLGELSVAATDGLWRPSFGDLGRVVGIYSIKVELLTTLKLGFLVNNILVFQV